ncbi:MAG TPA: TIGR04282 family arsenosugar biosynthesis glycosyltransferase [Burkholderiales bacterium]|nr:TIGR04282 family arsenosugar biosynthesis glycosyltransferase [Burkholderiales bacterium]
MRTDGDTRLIVFTRLPRPGAVKTRLIPLLGAEGAAALHVRLIERTLATARAAGIGTTELHCAPDCDDPYIRDCASRHHVALLAQEHGDLGARMAFAMRRALARSRHAVLIGTDCAVLKARHLWQAREALRAGVEAVLVPAEDGGYALIGLNRCDPRLFREITWGSAAVMNQTRDRLSELGWRWQELETLWDIDRPEDYRRLLALRLIDPIPDSDSPA